MVFPAYISVRQLPLASDEVEEDEYEYEDLEDDE